MWGVKIEQTKDGKHYVAGIGLSMEDTEEGKLSQFLVAANRIAFIDPANGNETPMFVAQGNQIFMNDVFLKRLTAPTITSGGSPPVFSLTSDGKLTAKNADISGSVNANSGTLNNVTVNENCTIKGMLEATQVIHCPAQQHLQVHTRILSVLVLIRTPLRLVHMDTPSPLTLLVTRKTPSKTSHLTIL